MRKYGDILICVLNFKRRTPGNNEITLKEYRLPKHQGDKQLERKNTWGAFKQKSVKETRSCCQSMIFALAAWGSSEFVRDAES